MTQGLADLISPTGRAVQGKLSQMTPDQFDAMAQQYVGTGMLSFSDLLSLKAQYDRLQQSGRPAQAPQTTVAQDLEQQMGGIADLPANVGNPQAYAKGGVVGFSGMDGSFVNGPYNPSDVEDYLKRHGNSGADEAVGRATKEPGLSRKIKYSKAGKLARGAARYYPAAVAGTAVFDALDPVSTEDMRAYYRAKGLPVDEYGDSLVGDLGVRTLGELQRTLTLGLTGPDHGNSGIAQATDAATSKAPPIDVGDYIRDTNALYGAGDSDTGGIAALVRPDLSGYDRAAQEVMAQRDTERGDTNRDARIAEAKREGIAAGLGQAGEEYGRELSAEKAGLGDERRRGSWLSAAEGFFDMAKAGSQGENFMGAAATGAQTGLKAYKELDHEIELRERELRKAQYELGTANEAREAGYMAEGTRRAETAKSRVDALSSELRSLSLAKTKVQIDVELANADNATKLRAAQIASTAYKILGAKEAAQLTTAFIRAVKEGKPQVADAIAERIAQLTTATSGTVQSALIRSQPMLPGVLPGGGTGGGGNRPEIVGVRPE